MNYIKSRFTSIEVLILIAIIAIITAVVVPIALNHSNVSKSHSNYDGWTYVTDAPYNHSFYVKHIPEQHVTIWYDDRRGTWQVVKD